MKQCPVCRNTYTDDSLSFCLTDGVALVAFASNDDSPTQVIPAGFNTASPTINTSSNQPPMVFNLGQESQPQVTVSNAEPTAKKDKTNLNLVTGLVIGILVSALLAGGIFAVLMMSRGSGKEEVASNKSNVQSETAPPKNTIAANEEPAANKTPDETEKLKDKIANLEKQMQQQKDPKPNVPIVADSGPKSNKITARVNSPGDGFLALRTQPSAETGERIMQIPHGSTVTVLACKNREAGKKGRWCRVDYSGNLGWAYDGFLTY